MQKQRLAINGQSGIAIIESTLHSQNRDFLIKIVLDTESETWAQWSRDVCGLSMHHNQGTIGANDGVLMSEIISRRGD